MPNGLGKLVRNSRFLCPHYFIINIRINPLNLLTQPQKRILINSEHCGLLFYIKVNNIPSGISIIRNFIKICFNEYIISDNAVWSDPVLIDSYLAECYYQTSVMVNETPGYFTNGGNFWQSELGMGMCWINEIADEAKV